MTFSDPVESLSTTAAELRNWDMRKREGLQDLLVRAADELDDQLKIDQDAEADSAMMVDASIEMENLRTQVDHLNGQVEILSMESRIMAELMSSCAQALDEAMDTRIGQMDSDSRASEKMQAAQAQVLAVAARLRGAA